MSDDRTLKNYDAIAIDLLNELRRRCKMVDMAPTDGLAILTHMLVNFLLLQCDNPAEMSAMLKETMHSIGRLVGRVAAEEAIKRASGA